MRDLFEKPVANANGQTPAQGSPDALFIRPVMSELFIETKEWVDCPECKRRIASARIEENQLVCPRCRHHFRMDAPRRADMLLDPVSFLPMPLSHTRVNRLNFPGYDKKLIAYQKKTGMRDALLAGTGCIKGQQAAVGILDYRFLMGSMGAQVGDGLTRLAELALAQRLPLIIVSASGGARMHEGIISLSQMAKVSAAVGRFQQAGGLFVSVLTDPTTGGVSASFAMLGDIIIAERKALIGFAGPRVIQQTIRKKVPPGFQQAENLMAHGFIDRVVDREELRDLLGQILRIHEKSVL
jgi:acetyl-CoA carboxylase carboxyl transferase beta subunit